MMINTQSSDFIPQLFAMRPTEVYSFAGTHGVVYSEDEQGEFATIGFNLPAGVLVEIEDGAYGQLQGFRVYNPDSQDAGLVDPVFTERD